MWWKALFLTPPSNRISGLGTDCPGHPIAETKLRTMAFPVKAAQRKSRNKTIRLIFAPVELVPQKYDLPQSICLETQGEKLVIELGGLV
jgi:hypothetical protein